jgi:hypothetical protein
MESFSVTKILRSRLTLLVVIAVLVGLFFLFDLDRFLTLEYAKSQREALLDAYAANRGMTVAIYMGIYIAVTALSLPGCRSPAPSARRWRSWSRVSCCATAFSSVSATSSGRSTRASRRTGRSTSSRCA